MQKPICIDTGALNTVSANKDDFVEFMNKFIYIHK